MNLYKLVKQKGGKLLIMSYLRDFVAPCCVVQSLWAGGSFGLNVLTQQHGNQAHGSARTQSAAASPQRHPHIPPEYRYN